MNNKIPRRWLWIAVAALLLLTAGSYLLNGHRFSEFTPLADGERLPAQSAPAGPAEEPGRADATVAAITTDAEPLSSTHNTGDDSVRTTTSEPVPPSDSPSLTERDDQSTATPSNNSVAEEDQDEKATPLLSQRVFGVIEEVQTRQLDGQWEEALNEMNALYQEFDELNPFEQATLLNFYTNTLLALEMLPEAITAFSQLLTVPDLRPEVNARALLALGQLHTQVGNPETAVSYYQNWLSATAGLEGMEEQIERVQGLLAGALAASAN